MILRSVLWGGIIILSAVISVLIWKGIDLLSLDNDPVLVSNVPVSPDPIQQFTLEDSPVAVSEILLEDRTGQIRSLKQETNKVILVNFWATWCLPCIHELPSLMRLSQHLVNEPFVLLTVALDRQGKDVVEPFLLQHDLLDLPVLFDPSSQTLPIFDIYGLPTTLLIGTDGFIRGRLQGFAVWDSPEAIRLIRDYYHEER